jgi:hypothetical protein
MIRLLLTPMSLENERRNTEKIEVAAGIEGEKCVWGG